VNDHIQQIVSGQAVEIVLNDGTYLREEILSCDLIGVVIEALVLDRSGGSAQPRIIPWSSIRDITLLSQYNEGGAYHVLQDHRIQSTRLDSTVYSSFDHSGFNSGISANESPDGGDCHICIDLSTH